MPEPLGKYQEAMLGLSRRGDYPSPEVLRQFSQTLTDAESDADRRIRALLRWHVIGSGRVSERLLLAEAPAALLSVLSAPDLTAAEIAGAARLVAQWPRRRRSELRRLPPAAWDRLARTARPVDEYVAEDAEHERRLREGWPDSLDARFLALLALVRDGMGYRDARRLDLLISARHEPREGRTVLDELMELERRGLVRRRPAADGGAGYRWAVADAIRD